jgi:hypothetical protein
MITGPGSRADHQPEDFGVDSGGKTIVRFSIHRRQYRLGHGKKHCFGSWTDRFLQRDMARSRFRHRQISPPSP